MIIYTNKFIKKGMDSLVFFGIAFIRPSRRGDKAFMEHEQVHLKQVYRTWFLHNFYYHFSKKYRLNSEVEAYKAQINAGYSKKSAAILLSSCYDLNISVEEALSKLS